jgi:hypothetical protein
MGEGRDPELGDTLNHHLWPPIDPLTKINLILRGKKDPGIQDPQASFVYGILGPPALLTSGAGSPVSATSAGSRATGIKNKTSRPPELGDTLNHTLGPPISDIIQRTWEGSSGKKRKGRDADAGSAGDGIVSSKNQGGAEPGSLGGHNCGPKPPAPDPDPGDIYNHHLWPPIDPLQKKRMGSFGKQAPGARGPDVEGQGGGGTIGSPLFAIDLEAATGNVNCQGIEFDGEYWWVTGGSNIIVSYLYKLSSSGQLLEKYPQPAGNWGFQGWRDIAYDGEFLYGGDDSAAPGMITQIDPANGRPTGVYIPTPLLVARALAYDAVTDSFWTADLNSLLYNIARNGTVLGAYPHFLSSVRGMAMEASGTNGQQLWIWSDDGGGMLASQFSPASGNFTGISWQGVKKDGATAGAACAYNDFAGSGNWVFAALHHGNPGDVIQGYRLSDADPYGSLADFGLEGLGTQGAPQLEYEDPYILSQGTLRLTSSSLQDELGIVYFGLSKAQIPFDQSGYTLWVNPVFSFSLTLSPGVTELPLIMPDSLWFTDTFWQLVQTDPGGKTFSGHTIAVSDGLKAVFGGPSF